MECEKCALLTQASSADPNWKQWGRAGQRVPPLFSVDWTLLLTLNIIAQSSAYAGSTLHITFIFISALFTQPLSTEERQLLVPILANCKPISFRISQPYYPSVSLCFGTTTPPPHVSARLRLSAAAPTACSVRRHEEQTSASTRRR